MITRFACLLFLLTATLSAQNQNAKSPPAGIALPEKDKAELLAGGRKLQSEVEALKKPGVLAKDVAEYVPDVEIFSKAVLWAVELNEIYNVKQVADARNLLKVGNERLADLKSGKTPWKNATGQVVRGYRSKIDGSVQPYGLIIPEDRPAKGGRLDIWLHGRSDVLTELVFLVPQMGKPKALVTPAKTITLNIYGRFCNAYKFAGVLSLEAATEHDPLDFFVLFSSVAALVGNPGQAAYAAAKAHPAVYASPTDGTGGDTASRRAGARLREWLQSNRAGE